MANILWIEDETDRIYGLVKPLIKDGHSITIAKDKDEALKTIKTMQHIDLIILDLIIPVGGRKLLKENITPYVGIDLLKQLRETEEITAPVIVFTVVSDEDALSEIREIGVSSILRKGSYLPSDLKMEVYKTLGIKK